MARLGASQKGTKVPLRWDHRAIGKVPGSVKLDVFKKLIIRTAGSAISDPRQAARHYLGMALPMLDAAGGGVLA